MGKLNKSPLDAYRNYMDSQVDKALAAYAITCGHLRSLKLLQWIKPAKIEFVDVGAYERCGLLDGRFCTCNKGTTEANPVDHWQGKPQSVDVAIRVPVSTWSDLVYNGGRFYSWRWGLRVVTEEMFMAELKAKPELILDVFTYPVNVNYLTPATTQAALYRWLKFCCPRLNYNLQLVPKPKDMLMPRRIES